MAAVSRRLARADGVSIVLEYAKQYDTCSEARTAPRVGSTCLTEASACFAYAMSTEDTFGTTCGAAGPALIDLHTQSGALSVQINKRRCSVSTLGPSSVLLPSDDTLQV